MNIDLLTIGDVSIDLYMKIRENETLPESNSDDTPKICFFHGSKIPVEHFEQSIAGNALNVAVACKSLGLNTQIYTELGDDGNGKKIIEELHNLGINTDYCIKNTDQPTNVHTVIVYSGDRTIFSYHHPRNYKIKGWEKPKWLYYTSLGYNFESFQKDLISYIKNNPDIGVAFNPGTIHMRTGVESFKNFLEITHVLFVNLEEAIKITNADTKDLNILHKELFNLGPRVTVITDSVKGASAYDGNNLVYQQIYSDERKVLDKTGAGDAFASGFLSALFYKKNITEALKWGVINSGNTIKKIGAINGLCNKDEIEEIINKL